MLGKYIHFFILCSLAICFNHYVLKIPMENNLIETTVISMGIIEYLLYKFVRIPRDLKGEE